VQISALCIPMHMACTMYCLRRNWEFFIRWAQTDVEKTRLMHLIREQKEMAETSVQRKTRFLASASHDLRQPMHAISLYLGGLAEMELPPRARRAVEDARECAHDLTDMLRSLLDISRLDAQQAVPNLSVFSMGTLLSRVEKEFAPLAHSRDVTFKVRPCADFVYSDPVMVERIAMNFVSNAVRHTPGGKVLVACRRRGNLVRLAVWDTGKGVPPGELQAIFEEFYRAETAPPDQTGGLGLGLAIVKRLAQTLRVNVDVRSKEGRGSMFAIDLPLMHVAVPARVQSSGDDPLAGRFILLVDDEVSILQAATFILEQAGCVVAAAKSGPAAIELLASSPRVPDAIVCDYELRDALNGPAVIRALRDEFNSEIPALLVTGDTSGEVEKAGEVLHAPVLYKPLESDALKTSLSNLLIEWTGKV
jgi:CheY-like chemotaxis protein